METSSRCVLVPKVGLGYMAVIFFFIKELNESQWMLPLLNQIHIHVVDAKATKELGLPIQSTTIQSTIQS